MEVKGKKLLILGGTAIHSKVVEAAKQLGVYTVVADYLENSPAKEIADEKWLTDIFAVDELVKRCKEEKIDGVINFCLDPASRPYQQVCEKLGFPCYGDEKQFFVLTDKIAFKKCCTENGVDIIPSFTENDIAQDKAEYPILVKPVDSQGSKGQSICKDKSETDAAIKLAKEWSSNGDIVIEKYMEGKQDFSMTYVVVDGEPFLTRTGDRFLGLKKDGLNKQCVFSMSPAKESELYIKNVHKNVVKMIKNIGIKNGPVFMQGFIDGEKIRFYDPGLRFPGTEYEKLYCQANNIDLVKMMVMFAITGSYGTEYKDLTDGYKLRGKTAVQMFITVRGGKIGAIKGIDEIRKHPEVVTVSPRYNVGDTVIQNGTVRQRVCEVVMLASVGTSIKDLVKWVQSKFVVLDDSGEDMLVSQVDPEMLQ